MVINMVKELRRRLNGQSEKLEIFNKELIEKNQTGLNSTITENKNILKGITSRLDDTEEQISKLEDRVVEITEADQKKEKRILKIEDSLRDL